MNVLVETLEKAPEGVGGLPALRTPLQVLRQKALLFRGGLAVKGLGNEELCLLVADARRRHHRDDTVVLINPMSPRV